MVLGGKGVGLVEMARLGAPVPPAFIVRTGVARAASQGQLPKKRLAWHIERGMRALERQTGKQFGDKSNPLLVSVRSGAPVSMPGMMDTILNLGLTPENFNGLVQQFGSSVADDIRVRFVKMFHNVVYVVDKGKLDQLFEDIEERADRKDVDVLVSAKIPVSPWKQLNEAIAAVHDSWNSERAKLYRQEHKIPDWWGTAVVVQAMVFGNRGEDSCSGVVFSRNVATGDDGLYGEFLVNSQGEDVVAGVRTPLPIARMQTWNPQIHGQLAEIVRQLEKHYNDVVDVEFTVEAGRLYILQCRVAKRTPEAALTIATHFVWEKRWTKGEALEKVSPKQISALSRPGFDEKALAEACVIGRGIPASPGAAGGMAVFSSEKAVALAKTFPQAHLDAVDVSEEALRVAGRNAARHGVGDRVACCRGDLWNALPPGRIYDGIFANLPYVPSRVIPTLEPEVLEEPRVALDGGADGLDCIRAFLEGLAPRLKTGGWAGMEVGWDQAPRVAELALQAGPFRVTMEKDLQGHDRFVMVHAV